MNLISQIPTINYGVGVNVAYVFYNDPAFNTILHHDYMCPERSVFVGYLIQDS